MKLLTLLIAFTLSHASHKGNPELFNQAKITVSSHAAGYPGEKATDGKTGREYSWLTDADARAPHFIELKLEKYADIDSVTIWSGIPENEKKGTEKTQAPGYWSVKNLHLQYWDDANWTDIPGTEITENRKEKITLSFVSPVRTYRIRLLSFDGEQIMINEIRGYGKFIEDMPSPENNGKDNKNEACRDFSAIEITVGRDTAGRSMQFVGYNQGYYMPESNISDWVEWSEVNSMRLWTDLNSYSEESWMTPVKIDGIEEFEMHKKQLRESPESGKYIKTDSVASNAAMITKSTNSMELEYALKELKRLSVTPLLQINNRDFGKTWEEKFIVWRRYYALAFYAAKTGDATMFAIQNEPNHRHSGPMKIETYIEGMRLASDAVHCAVEDVSRIYGKNLKAQFVGPVTAGTNTDWWSKVTAAEGIDYKGEKTDNELIDIFSTHSYNSPAAGYRNKVNSIREIIKSNHPEGKSKPIVFTETGRWMNAYLIDKEETMDSPTLFTEWAGMYTNNMLNGCYGMWAFKMANTTSSTYPRGIKSGHHHIWKGRRIIEDSYDNLAAGKKVLTSDGTATVKLTDCDKSDKSVWEGRGKKEKWVEIDLGKEEEIHGAIVYTGSSYGEFTGPDRIRNSRMEAFVGGGWKTIPETVEKGCKYVQCIYTFKNGIKTDKIRYVAEDTTDVKIREIKLFGKDILSAEESHDIGGAMRTAQVVRMFAKGFKESRPLMQTEKSIENDDLDAVTSVAEDGSVHVWIVQRNRNDCMTTLDLSALSLDAGQLAVIETVSGNKYGEASIICPDPDGKYRFVTEALSVNLITVTPFTEKKETKAAMTTGIHRDGKDKTPEIHLDASEPESNSVVLIQFPVNGGKIEKANKILLETTSQCSGNTLFKYHVYLFSTDKKIQGRNLSWGNIPYLDKKEPRAVSEDTCLHFAGEMTASPEKGTHLIDITHIAKKHSGKYLNFILVRETAQPGDDCDKDKSVIIMSGKENCPVLHTW